MLELFRRLAVELATNPPPTDPRFSFPNRIVVFPEILCPYCNAPLRCKRIWHIKNGQVPKWWDIVPGPSLGRGRRRGYRLVVNDIGSNYVGGHPHVGCSGNICMGNAKTEEQALFSGICVSESYWTNSETFKWLKTVWDHKCPEDREDYD